MIFSRGPRRRCLPVRRVHVTVFYSKGDVIVDIPFPGASFKIPGIVTIGPQLTVERTIDASLSLAGTIETKLEIAS